MRKTKSYLYSQYSTFTSHIPRWPKLKPTPKYRFIIADEKGRVKECEDLIRGIW
jgi:hypothetical protein